MTVSKTHSSNRDCRIPLSFMISDNFVPMFIMSTQISVPMCKMNLPQRKSDLLNNEEWITLIDCAFPLYSHKDPRGIYSQNIHYTENIMLLIITEMWELMFMSPFSERLCLLSLSMESFQKICYSGQCFWFCFRTQKQNQISSPWYHVQMLIHFFTYICIFLSYFC